MAIPGLSRKRLFLAILSLLAVGVAVASVVRSGPAIVTWAALREARGICRAVGAEAGADPIFDFGAGDSASKPPANALEEGGKALERRYGALFRRGWFDPGTLGTMLHSPRG